MKDYMQSLLDIKEEDMMNCEGVPRRFKLLYENKYYRTLLIEIGENFILVYQDRWHPLRGKTLNEWWTQHTFAVSKDEMDIIKKNSK